MAHGSLMVQVLKMAAASMGDEFGDDLHLPRDG